MRQTRGICRRENWLHWKHSCRQRTSDSASHKLHTWTKWCNNTCKCLSVTLLKRFLRWIDLKCRFQSQPALLPVVCGASGRRRLFSEVVLINGAVEWHMMLRYSFSQDAWRTSFPFFSLCSVPIFTEYSAYPSRTLTRILHFCLKQFGPSVSLFLTLYQPNGPAPPQYNVFLRARLGGIKQHLSIICGEAGERPRQSLNT